MPPLSMRTGRSRGEADLFTRLYQALNSIKDAFIVGFAECVEALIKKVGLTFGSYLCCGTHSGAPRS